MTCRHGNGVGCLQCAGLVGCITFDTVRPDVPCTDGGPVLADPRALTVTRLGPYAHAVTCGGDWVATFYREDAARALVELLQAHGQPVWARRIER